MSSLLCFKMYNENTKNSKYNLFHTLNFQINWPYLKMGMLRLLPEAMYGALMLWQKRMKVSRR